MGTRSTFPLLASSRHRLERVGQEFLAGFLERETERHPDNVPALAELAHVLTRMGRVEDGLSTDRRLVELAPENPTVRYNLACSLALLGRKQEALDALEQAVDLGYDDPDHLLEDRDLDTLHHESRFVRLLDLLRATNG